ncbi:hypothetical protein [Dactylosporangium sp. NPDC005555]|uniref:hypothetical protein n=1 Tax=Dactylosporangium sp. NPDC005555 TaxID=3154889 RepID=UPI0033B6CD5A
MHAKTLTATVLAAALLLGGCAASPERRGGDAEPAGSAAAPTTSPAAPATPITPSTAVSTAATTNSATLVLGPRGYGALRLGMTKQQAVATGLLSEFADYACPAAFLKGLPSGDGRVVVSPEIGVVFIAAPEKVATPEGVRIGTSGAVMRGKYPTWKVVQSDGTTYASGFAKVPGNDKAEYWMWTKDDKVTALALMATGNVCTS